jgi:two-component system, cell cycle sensor histidine kinase and response regulator CckA
MRKSESSKGEMHSLLNRQIRRQFGTVEAIPESAIGLLEAVDEAYRQNDADRALLERALEMSSQELLQANSQMRAMLQATPDVFIHVAIDGTVLYYKTDPIVELFCSRAEAGDARRGLVLESDFFELFNRAIEELLHGAPMACFDVEQPGARDRVFEVRIVMLFLDQAVIYIRDITEAKGAERDLRESEERYRSLFDGTPHPMWVYDPETLSFLAVNNAAVLHYGYSRGEFLSMIIKDIRRSDQVPELMRSMQEIAETMEQSAFGVFKHRKKDGTEIDVEIASSAIVFAGHKARLVLALDVTEKRRLEAEREGMQRQLEQAHRLSSLGHLGATMAHEFNNVLMGIQPFAEAVARAHPESTVVQNAVQRIGTAIKRGKGVTAEILSFTRKTTLIRKPIALDAWLDELAAEARAVLPMNIELQLDVCEGLVVSGDAAHLQQVFLNLMLNARDAIAGAGTLALQVRPGSGGGVYPFGVVENVEAFAHFTLADSGSGISPEAMSHVFEPLFTTKRSGTGLGLALTHRIVLQHDGHIFIESEEGRGTSIHIFLPLAVAPQSEEETASTERRNVRRLVLVEDDPAVSVGLSALLELEGIDVTVAENGAAAMEVIARARPDAVLLDVGLPDISGTEVYLQIAERWPSMPVIFSTGHADLSRIRDLTSEPHVGYLLKPYGLTDLLDMLGTVGAGRPITESRITR